MKTRRATVSFKTVGCRLNQAETAVIRASFEEAGFATVNFGDACDVCVINGCVVTSKAEEDSLRLVRSIKHRHPGVCVVLAGCAAELLGMAATPFSHSRANGNPSAAGGPDSRLPLPAMLAGQKEKFNLPEILGMRFQTAEKRPAMTIPLFNTQRAIVRIQDGCDCQCAYCIVPRVRGPGRSRPSAEIIEEITRLTLCGFPEIVLTGANIGCYANGQCKLPQLLEQIEAIKSLQRFRISSLEISNVGSSFPACHALRVVRSGIQEKERWIPASAGMTHRRRNGYGGQADIIEEVIDFMASSKKICRFLHLPLQSGSDSILKAMGRPYTAGQFAAVVQYAREKLGVFGLGTDIIVGFPGETEEDFMETERLAGKLPFSKLHVFSYSPRPGTPACSMPGKISAKDKDLRSTRLIELGRRKRNEFAQSLTGKCLCFVVEKVKDGWAEGWTGEYLRARVHGPELKPKQIVEFLGESTADDVLLGKINPKSGSG